MFSRTKTRSNSEPVSRWLGKSCIVSRKNLCYDWIESIIIIEPRCGVNTVCTFSGRARFSAAIARFLRDVQKDQNPLFADSSSTSQEGRQRCRCLLVLLSSSRVGAQEQTWQQSSCQVSCRAVRQSCAASFLPPALFCAAKKFNSLCSLVAVLSAHVMTR